MSEEDFSKFTRPRLDNEIHQGSEVPVTFGIDPSDGLPRPSIPDNQDRPPPLAVDTFVCMEDKRSFVIRRKDGSIWLTFDPSEVTRKSAGYYVAPRALANEKNGSTVTNFDLGLSDALAGDDSLVMVSPIRPACEHYIRMQTDISADRDRRYLSRSCAAQRSETGEYYSVGDAAIYACSLRSPRHPETEALMDEIDERDARLALNKAKAGAFDVDAELAKIAQDESSPGSLGVLGNKG